MDQWRRGIRPVLLAVGALQFAVAVLFWRYVAHGHIVAAFLLGAVAGMSAWIWTEPPAHISKWKRGSEGERRTEKALRALENDGWRLYHDRDDERGNLDHVLVGSAGVFLLDSKNLAGEIRVDTAGLTVDQADSPRDSFTYQALETRLRGAAARLKEAIEKQTALRLWVQAVVVIWGDFPQGLADGDRVTYVAGDRLREWLTARPPARLSERERNLIALAIDAGYVAPPAKPIPATAPSGPPARAAS